MTSNEEGAAGREYPVSEWKVDVPFDSSDWMRKSEPTYGGEPMEDWLPRREEWPVIWRVQAGMEVTPVHDAHVDPLSVVGP